MGAWIASCARSAFRVPSIIVIALGTAAAAQDGQRAPVKVLVFEGSAAADAGLAESVADFKRAIADKHAGTMRLVDRREEADVGIEVVARSSNILLRDVTIVVHHRGGSDRLLRQPRMSNRFTTIANETMQLLDAWIRDNHKAVAGLAPADTIVPLRLFAAFDDLKNADPVTRANTASRLGTQRTHAALIAPELAKLLGSFEEVAHPQNRHARERLGAIAAASLVRLGALDTLLEAVASAGSDYARADAASVLHELGGGRTLDALATALRRDKSSRVRKAAAKSLGSLRNGQGIAPLIEALQDSDKGVRREAADALKDITREDFGEDAARWRQWQASRGPT